MKDCQQVGAISSELVFLRAQVAAGQLGLSKSTFYAVQDPGSDQYDQTFPRPYQLTARTKVWSCAELMEWVESRKVLEPSLLIDEREEK